MRRSPRHRSIALVVALDAGRVEPRDRVVDECAAARASANSASAS